MKFGSGDLMEKTCRETPNLVENRALYTKPWYVLLLPATLIRDKIALFEWNGIGLSGERNRHSVTLYVHYLSLRSSLQFFKAKGCLKIGKKLFHSYLSIVSQSLSLTDSIVK
jgi:hypothetical protein